LAVAAISWFELAWLARHERIVLAIPIRSWLERLAGHVRTLPLTPAVAEAAVSLPSSFAGDPADRLIYATAIEHGAQLVTKDRKLRDHPHPKPITVW
jgi:PIN domain nuclease of toxin-antitoxin system